MNLKKDREDQSKYYLSYPKPPVLDIKWENHDINVEGWANILKFLPLLNGDATATQMLIQSKCIITGNKQLQKRNMATLNSAHQAKKQCNFGNS